MRVLARVHAVPERRGLPASRSSREHAYVCSAFAETLLGVGPRGSARGRVVGPGLGDSLTLRSRRLFDCSLAARFSVTVKVTLKWDELSPSCSDGMFRNSAVSESGTTSSSSSMVTVPDLLTMPALTGVMIASVNSCSPSEWCPLARSPYRRAVAQRPPVVAPGAYRARCRAVARRRQRDRDVVIAGPDPVRPGDATKRPRLEVTHQFLPRLDRDIP